MTDTGKPALPPVETDRLISGKIIGILKKILYYGFPVAARFKTSVRVGSGTALSALDGTDGQIVADGAGGSLTFGDRAGGGAFAQWFYASGAIHLFSSLPASDLWSVAASTGIATLIANSMGTWAKVAGGVGFLNSWTDLDATETTWHQAAYMMDICGVVHLRGLIKSGTIGSSAFTLPAGFHPAKRKEFTVMDGANTGQRLDVLSTGSVIPVTGNNTSISLDGITFDTRA